MAKFWAKFSFTMPSLAAKNASTVEMKWRSLSLSFCSQSFMSWQRSISSAVQNEASAFLYMAQTSACSMGKSTKRFGFSMSSGSGVKSSYEPASSRFFISDAPLGTKRALRTGELWADLGLGGGDAARLGFWSAAEAIMFVTSLMPDSRAAILDERGSAGGGAVARRRGAVEVVAGAPALRESGACVPFERDEGLRPLGWARGAASVRLGAVEPRSTTRRRHRCHSSAGEPLVPRLTDSAVARLLWGTSEQRQRRRVSVTSSEGVYGVISVTKTQRPTMGNARLAKLNDRVEKTGSGFARAAKTRAVCLTRALPSTLRSP